MRAAKNQSKAAAKLLGKLTPSASFREGTSTPRSIKAETSNAVLKSSVEPSEKKVYMIIAKNESAGITVPKPRPKTANDS